MAIARTRLLRECKAALGARLYPCVVPAFAGATPELIRRQRDLVVDQGIERRLDVDLGVDDAGLLQRQPGGEDRLALRRADPAVGQFGTLLELPVDHSVRQ